MTANSQLPPQQMSFVQRHLIIPKVLYFTMNLAYYSCYAFRPKYLDQAQGIKTKDYGIIAAILSLVLFAAGYFWSYLTDRIGHMKQILILTSLLSGLVFQFLIIPYPQSSKMILSAIVSGVYIFFVGALVPLLDALAMKMLATIPGASKELYGRQRMFGTIGYAVISVVVSSGPMKPNVNFYVGALSVFFAVVVFFLYNEPTQEKVRKDVEVVNKKTEKKPESVQQTVQANGGKSPLAMLMTNPNFLFLLFVVFMNGLGRATMTHFLEPIQRNVFRTPQWATGISYVSGVFLEAVVFFFGKPLLLYFGYRRLLVLSQIAMVIRVSLYAWAPRQFEFAKFIPLFYELLKGLGFGFMQTAAVTWVSDISTPETKATAQSIYTGVFSGISAFVAGLVGYFIQAAVKETGDPKIDVPNEIQQSSFMLSVTAIISIIALILFIIKYIIIEEMMAGKKNNKK